MDVTKEDIVKELGFEPPRMVGYYIALRIPVREKLSSESVIELSTETQKSSIYTSIVGKVIDIGTECFPSERFPSGPRCKLGDWVVYKPNTGTKFKYRGVPVELIPDDVILSVVEDPNYVERH